MREVWFAGEEPEEWHEAVKDVKSCYSDYLAEWNAKGFKYKPSFLFGSASSILRWLQMLDDEEDVFKIIFGLVGGIIAFLLIFIFL